MLKAWTEKSDDDFSIIDSHEKGSAIRDSSKKATLEARLKERLRNSKNMVLIIGETTKDDIDWVPMEITYAIDNCDIPIIAAYTGYKYILQPASHSNLWPAVLKTRIDNSTASVIHIPFKKEPLKDAISQFSHDNKPTSGLSYYSKDAYASFGIQTN